jgi:hypothetical protein
MVVIDYQIKSLRRIFMNIYLLVLLRTIHVFAGALWIGAAISYLFFIKPSVKSIGTAGPKFMQNLAERRRYPLFMVSVSLLTVLAGGALYLFASGGFNPFWIKSGPGLGFSVGALAGLIAFLVGNFGIGPTSARMGIIGEQISISGGQPSPEQLGELQALERKLKRTETIDFVMLTISMLAMATARYWFF